MQGQQPTDTGVPPHFVTQVTASKHSGGHCGIEPLPAAPALPPVVAPPLLAPPVVAPPLLEPPVVAPLLAPPVVAPPECAPELLALPPLALPLVAAPPVPLPLVPPWPLQVAPSAHLPLPPLVLLPQPKQSGRSAATTTAKRVTNRPWPSRRLSLSCRRLVRQAQAQARPASSCRWQPCPRRLARRARARPRSCLGASLFLGSR